MGAIAHWSRSLTIVVLFLLTITYLGLKDTGRSHVDGLTEGNGGVKPLEINHDVLDEGNAIDFYVQLRTLTREDLGLDRTDARVIVIGDVHGMLDAVENLLSKLSYNPTQDTLLHVGDLLAKSSVSSSLSTLQYFTAQNISGALGNHDDKVLRWRQWLEWLYRQKGKGMGVKKWLRKMEEMSRHEMKIYMKGGENNVDETNLKAKWKIPDGWEFGGEHYWIAKKMTPQQFAYLSSLPLALHLPSLHTYIAHAGLLPSDPTRSPQNSKQPLSKIPRLPPPSKDKDKKQPPPPQPESLRTLQELAVLHDIPQNTDPWVVTNMRSIELDGRVSKKAKGGIPWSVLWNAMMGRCRGFGEGDDDFVEVGGDEVKVDMSLPENFRTNAKLPCHPSTTIYGHAASRGLDVKRWSLGLDSGCVYGRRLSALVISSDRQLQALGPDNEVNNKQGDEMSIQSVKFGEEGRARIVSVACRIP